MPYMGAPLSKWSPFLAVALLVVGAVLISAAMLGLDSYVLFEGEFSGSSSFSGASVTVGSVELEPGEYEVWMEESPTFLFISLTDYDVEGVDAAGNPVPADAAGDTARKINGIDSERGSTITIADTGVCGVRVTEVWGLNFTDPLWVFVITPRTAAYYGSVWGGAVLIVSGVVLLGYAAIQKGAKQRAEERARRARQAPPVPVAPVYPQYPQYPPYPQYQPYPQAPPPYQQYPEPPPPYPPYPQPPQQQQQQRPPRSPP
jgi:hypothetical protein